MRPERGAAEQRSATRALESSPVAPRSACGDTDAVPYTLNCIAFMSGWFGGRMHLRVDPRRSVRAGFARTQATRPTRRFRRSPAAPTSSEAFDRPTRQARYQSSASSCRPPAPSPRSATPPPAAEQADELPSSHAHPSGQPIEALWHTT